MSRRDRRRLEARARTGATVPEAPLAVRIVLAAEAALLDDRTDEALALLQQGLAVEPGNIDLLFHIGRVLQRLAQPVEAEQVWALALTVHPADPRISNELGLMLGHQGRLREAAALFQTSLARYPREPDLLANLGHAQHRLGETEAGLATIAMALALRPHFPMAWAILAEIAHDRAQDATGLAETLAWSDKAAPYLRDHASFRLNRAYHLLAAGRLAEGWAEYAARLDGSLPFAPYHHLDLPRWRGESLAGKSLLVLDEQGLGDAVLYATLLPDLIAAGAAVTLECDARLVPLLERSVPGLTCRAGVTETIRGRVVHRFPWLAEAETPPELVVQLGDLPGLLRPTLASFPRVAAPLVPDPARVAQFRARLAALPGLKVGIGWRSMVRNDRRDRSYRRADDLGRLLAAPGVSFVSLQYGEVAEELAQARRFAPIAVMDGLDLTRDLDGVAALAAALDAVVTAPTLLWTLAAGVGTPTFCMVPQAPWVALGEPTVPFLPAARMIAPAPGADRGWRCVDEQLLDELAMLRGTGSSRIPSTRPAGPERPGGFTNPSSLVA